MITAVEDGWHTVVAAGEGIPDPLPNDDRLADLIKKLGPPALAEMLTAGSAVGPLMRCTAPRFQRRRFDRATGLPVGVIALGASVTCPDPLHGRQLSIAARHACALEETLHEVGRTGRGSRSLLARRYFTAAFAATADSSARTTPTHLARGCR
jgi:hypothetical protein